MISTLSKRKWAARLLPIVLWLIVWHLLSLYVGHSILLVSPIAVIVRLAQLMREISFWQSIMFSFRSIAGGFFLAAVGGALLASFSAKFRLIENIIAPLILTIKATPVASIIILVLLWISSRNLSIVISFMMVIPIIYTNVLSGIKSTDIKLLEMSTVFQMSLPRRVIYIYVPHILPFFKAACSVALGLCWKSGIAAEVIGTPDGSIGENLYKAKIFLATADLFAWTLTIIIISILFERFFMFALKTLTDKLINYGD